MILDIDDGNGHEPQSVDMKLNLADYFGATAGYCEENDCFSDSPNRVVNVEEILAWNNSQSQCTLEIKTIRTLDVNSEFIPEEPEVCC